MDDLEAQFRTGDDDALRAAYDAHGSLVYSYCRRVAGPDRADDLTQETFIAGWRGRDRFDPERGALAGWLIGIAKNKCIDLLRYEGRRPSTAVADVPARSDSQRELSDIGDRMLLADGIDRLPPRARKAIELSFFDQLTHTEIAEHTGIPIGTVKSDIRRGLARLRRHMDQHDG